MSDSISPRHIFSTNHLVSSGDQRRIIESVKSAGEFSSGAFRKDIDAFWKWKSLTLPIVEKLPERVRRYFSNRPHADFDNWAYFSRLDPGLEWRWVDVETSELVRRILDPMM